MRYASIVSLALVLNSCAAPTKEAADVGTVEARSTEDLSSRFHGSWTLVSFKNSGEDGEEFYPFGEDAFGRIVYASSGNMAVVLMGQGRDVRRDWSGFDELDADEMRTVLTRFFAYSGAFTVDAEAQTVTHHVEACLAPGWVGTDRVRAFEFLSDDRIALRPQEGTSELIWQRER